MNEPLLSRGTLSAILHVRFAVVFIRESTHPDVCLALAHSFHVDEGGLFFYPASNCIFLPRHER
jgi:hypothetical protein